MNIEKKFYEYTENSSVFPDSNDYVSAYKSFKSFMDKEVHPEIKTITTRLDDEVYLNDHSDKHVATVIAKISEILAHKENLLTPYELFFLLVAVQIHDAGHIYSGREGHEKAAGKFLEQFNKYVVSTIERNVIKKIAHAHSGKDDPIGQLEIRSLISGEEIHPRLLAALLRLGDELADGHSRASNYLIDIDKIPSDSLLYHIFSSCLDTFKASTESHEITMCFYVKKEYATTLYSKKKHNKTENIYLIDEIYLRTVKTFNECIYYNRFVPEELRINSINVSIIFLDENGDEYYKQINYRLEEKGYPTLATDNIFELTDELICNGEKLTGDYINRKLQP